ncbi:uncharacterized protein [Triticum aestivum]|uniref:uncharacterized protein n=1 Tax=Triticum aestivum TaxID=4565 RepID=UPI001D01E6A4|nr:uncharacterized protein LOC123138865 [Triticum aestivum]
MRGEEPPPNPTHPTKEPVPSHSPRRLPSHLSRTHLAAGHGRPHPLHPSPVIRREDKTRWREIHRDSAGQAARPDPALLWPSPMSCAQFSHGATEQARRETRLPPLSLSLSLSLSGGAALHLLPRWRRIHIHSHGPGTHGVTVCFFSMDMELPQHTMEGLELLLTAGAPRIGGKTNAPPGLLLPGSPLLHGRRSSGCHHTKGEESKMNLSRLTVHDRRQRQLL